MSMLFLGTGRNKPSVDSVLLHINRTPIPSVVSGPNEKTLHWRVRLGVAQASAEAEMTDNWVYRPVVKQATMAVA